MFEEAAGRDAWYQDEDKDVHRLTTVVGVTGEFWPDRGKGAKAVSGIIKTEHRGQ